MHEDDGPAGRGASPFLIRPAVADDYPAFARLFPHLEVDDPLPLPRVWQSVLVPWTTVAQEAGQVVGYCYCQEYQDTGYVRNLVVAPEARRRGVGRALMTALAQSLRTRSKILWCLNVTPQNAAALALYQGLGFQVRYRATVLRLPWSALASLPSGKEVARQLSPARDALVESQFGMPRGQLKHARESGRLLLECTSPSSPSSDSCGGVAVFDANFPGAFPFRVIAPEAAGALLSAIRAHVPHHQFVALVVEEDARLGDMLVARGATIRVEILHLQGRP